MGKGNERSATPGELGRAELEPKPSAIRARSPLAACRLSSATKSRAAAAGLALSSATLLAAVVRASPRAPRWLSGVWRIWTVWPSVAARLRFSSYASSLPQILDMRWLSTIVPGGVTPQPGGSIDGPQLWGCSRRDARSKAPRLAQNHDRNQLIRACLLRLLVEHA